METEVKRVTTTKKSNKLVTTLLIIAGILGFILILAAIYFYKIKPATEKKTVGDKMCTCYYIDPISTSECGDPRKGFGFSQSVVKENIACPPCSTSNIDTTKLNTTTKLEDFIACQLQNVQDTRCKLMTIRDEQGKIVTGQISPEDEITVEATFDKKYVNPQFSVNNQLEDPDTISEDGLTIKKSFTNFTDSSLELVATADDDTGDSVNSPLCKRVLSVTQQAGTVVTALQFTTRSDGKTNKVAKTTLKASNLKESDTLSIDFSFDSTDFAKLSMNKGLTLDETKGEIVMIEQDLYKAENFSNAKSFSQLDGFVGTVHVVAELKDGTTPLGKAATDLLFKEITSPSPTTPKEQEPEKPPEEETEESNFSVTGKTSETCLDRVAPNNAVTYTINITNNASTSQTIKSITNKLPLGFRYVLGSTKINTVSITDIDYLRSTNIGQTTELVWTTTSGWSISAGQTLTLVFNAEAGENALTGPNQNEVVIEPTQVPLDPKTLRAEIVTNVEQTCNPVGQPTDETPDTGIFDSLLSKIIVGILILVVGWYIYTKPFGQIVAKKFVDSEMYRGAEMTSWRIFKPKKYFEEITIKRLGRKKKE